MCALQVADDDKNHSIIRFDLRFPSALPEGKPREVWFDHAIVQETCSTHAEDTLKYFEASTENLPEDLPAFQKTYGAKMRRY